MIQITKWIDPDENIWHQGRYVTAREWVIVEADRIKRDTGLDTHIKSNNEGFLSIYRDKYR